MSGVDDGHEILLVGLGSCRLGLMIRAVFKMNCPLVSVNRRLASVARRRASMNRPFASTTRRGASMNRSFLLLPPPFVVPPRRERTSPRRLLRANRRVGSSCVRGASSTRREINPTRRLGVLRRRFVTSNRRSLVLPRTFLLRTVRERSRKRRGLRPPRRFIRKGRHFIDPPRRLAGAIDQFGLLRGRPLDPAHRVSRTSPRLLSDFLKRQPVAGRPARRKSSAGGLDRRFGRSASRRRLRADIGRRGNAGHARASHRTCTFSRRWGRFETDHPTSCNEPESFASETDPFGLPRAW